MIILADTFGRANIFENYYYQRFGKTFNEREIEIE